MSGYKYNYKEIGATYDIVDIARRLRLDIKPGKQSGNFRTMCPKCKGDDRKLSITSGKGFRCWGCDAKGDCISLVRLVNGGTENEACAFITGATEPEKSARAEPKTDGFKELDYLQPEHEAVEDVGFPLDVAKAVGIGYAPRGMMRGLVAVPIRLPDGKLIGYAGIDDAKLPTEWKL